MNPRLIAICTLAATAVVTATGFGWSTVDDETSSTPTDASQSQSISPQPLQENTRSESERNEAARLRLAMPCVADEVKLAESNGATRLGVWLSEITKARGIPLWICCEPELVNVGHGRYTKQSLGIPLRMVLRYELSEHGLEYRFDDGVMIIEEDIGGEGSQKMEVYDITSLAAASENANDLEGLIDLITDGVEPLSWENNGGPQGAQIHTFGNKLIITNVDMVHRKVQDLLERLEH